MLAMPRLDPPRLVQAVALLATLMGLLFWGYLLRTQISSVAPTGASPIPVALLEEPAQRWFEAPSEIIEVKLVGLICGSSMATAILSVNGAPVRVYSEGETLARTTKLRRIEVDAVLIERSGEVRRVAMEKLAEPPALDILKRG